MPANPQQSYIRLQSAAGDISVAKRVRGREEDLSIPHFEGGAFGGRGNFLPADSPVVFKRSASLKRVKEAPFGVGQQGGSEVLAKASALHVLY